MIGNRIIVCKYVHHGNTMKISERIATTLNAPLHEPEDVSAFGNLNGGILGIGSGIYFGRFHRSIHQWVDQLPKDAGHGQKALLFSASGLSFLSRFVHRPIRRVLQRKGSQVIGEFACWPVETPLCSTIGKWLRSLWGCDLLFGPFVVPALAGIARQEWIRFRLKAVLQTKKSQHLRDRMSPTRKIND